MKLSLFQTKLLGLILSVFLWTSFSIAKAETLGHRRLDSGDYHFQIVGAEKKSAYKIALLEFNTEVPLEWITVDTSMMKGSVININWTPGNQQGLYWLRLEKNGVLLDQESSIHPLSMDDFLNKPGSLNRKDKTIHWNLASPSLSRVVLMTGSGAFIDTVKGWHVSDSGAYTQVWDASRPALMRIVYQSPGILVGVQSFPLPRDLICFGESDFASYLLHPLFNQLSLPRQVYEFDIDWMQMGRGTQETQAAPLSVKPGDLLRVELTGDTKSILSKERFEILFFWDGDFIHEETEAYDGYNYVLPEIDSVSGEHYVVVNVRDYDGNVGRRISIINYKE